MREQRSKEVIHELKTWPEHYNAVYDGSKKCEVREHDRNYQVGDYLHLKEWDPLKGQYTGYSHYQRVTHILWDTQFVKDGFVIMSLQYGGTER